MTNIAEPTEAIPSKLGHYIDAAKMWPRELGLWLERFVQSKTDTTGYGWDDRWKAQRAREMLDHLDTAMRASAPQEPDDALPIGREFIDREALDRWRDANGKNGHDLAANNNTVWRLVATIDYLLDRLQAKAPETD